MPTLFSDYLGFFRGGPLGHAKNARSHIQLVNMASPGVTNATPHSLSTLPYWTSFVKVDGVLASWLETPQAFRPPHAWFTDCALRDLITPMDFALDILPKAPGNDAVPFNTQRYKRWCLGQPDLPILAAYCYGWNLTSKELARARAVADALTAVPQFLIYAKYSMDHVPAPFSNAAYMTRLRARQRLSYDPLILSKQTLAHALPDWARTASAVLRHGVDRGYPMPSSKYPWILNPDGTRVKKTRTVA